MDVSPEPHKPSPRYPRMLPVALLGLLSAAATAEEAQPPVNPVPTAEKRTEAPPERTQRPPQRLEGEVVRELPSAQLPPRLQGSPPAPDRRPPQRTPGKTKLPPKR
ncbi:MAG: hypothetical protein ACI4OS_00880 [Akkermansia sp.]